MWIFPTKKELKKEISDINKSFKERDETIDKLKEKIENNSLKIATLEGFILNKSQVSVSGSLRPSQANFETKLIQRIRNNKKALVMAEIMKLKPSHTTQGIFDIIVKERGLCSKASFYRYISSLNSQGLTETEANIETKLRPTQK